LILAIVFMAILSILGTVVLNVANREIKEIAGSPERAGLLPEKDAFYLVDRTVEYSLNSQIIQAINDKITLGTDPAIDFTSETTPGGILHSVLLRAGGGPQLTSGTIRQLGVAELSFNQISRIASGASAKDIFIRYHLNASACPQNVDCVSFPKETIRVDAQLVEVRPNPSGSSGSSEETGDTIWGNI
jgi:hypothetical protein